jgi:uncharacterized protein (UPF0332 family)
MNQEETHKLLEKGKSAIHAADVLLQANEVEFAVGRAYYAMLYVAKALLADKGIRAGRKHSSVHALFGEHFAKPEVLDAQFHRWLIDAFDQRLLGDYEIEATLTVEQVREVVQRAREFLQAALQYLKSGPRLE